MRARPCTFPGCPSLVPSGRCPAHQPSSASSSPTNTHTPPLSHKFKPFYNSKAWKDLRLYKLSISPVCESCNLALATEVHHIQSLESRWDLRLDMGNLGSRCKPCHSKETAERDGSFGRAREKGCRRT